MLKILKTSSIKLSLIAALAIVPSTVNAASGGGFIEGSSESTFALIENPNFEGQLVRINTGINLIRLNTDILENMPVSVDSTWVDAVVGDIDFKVIRALPAVKNDAYYSTVAFTNRLLGRGLGVPLSPLGARSFHQANAIYVSIPNMNIFPNLSDSKTFVTFEDAKLIDVEAKGGNLYKSVEEATISLLPEDMIESALSAKTDYIEAREVLKKANDKVGEIEIWLDDDKNDNSSETKTYEANLELAEAEVDAAKEVLDTKEEIYFKILEDGAIAIETNYDERKLPLAKKLEKLLDSVDNNAIGAVSMFTSALAGLTRGLGEVENELMAINHAIINNTNINSQAYKALQKRKTRMAQGALMAIPNIGIGTYYAFKQSSLAGEYQQIVDKVIEAGEIAVEAKEAAAEVEKEDADKSHKND